MPRVAISLTNVQIKKAMPQDKAYSLFDGQGLFLEVMPNGKKYWRIKYQFDKKTKKKGLGVYPEVGLQEARAKRDNIRKILRDGDDPYPPKETKSDDRSSVKTFKQWGEWYIDEISSELSDSHITRTLKSFKKDVYPAIGEMPMNDVSTKDIISIMHTMKDRGAIESARKTFSAINRVFSKSISNFPDDVERNPTADITLSDVIGKKQTVSYPIITGDKELGALLKTISEYGIDSSSGTRAHSSTRLALQMISHTFVRPANVRLATWSEVDMDAKQWVIPGSKMKTKKELIVPLSEQAIAILEEAKEASPDSEYIFPSNRSKTSPMSDNAMVGALRRMGYEREEIVAHSFRGIFSTIAHEKGIYGHEVIETQLAHSVGNSVSQAYNRAVYLKERTEMMQWYSTHLSDIVKAVKKD